MDQMNIPENLQISIDYEDPKLPGTVAIFKPLLWKERESFCCIVGPNPQTGVFGCGETAQEALIDWDKHLQALIDNPRANNEISEYVTKTMDAFNDDKK